MSTPKPRLRLPAAVRAAACLAGSVLAFHPTPGGAEVTINFGSSTGGSNLQSTGREMDSSFTFQIGAFRPGFVPDATNTSEWVREWMPVANASGIPAQGSSTAYDDRYLFPDGEGEYRVNSFSGVTVLSHNTAPFNHGGDVFVWGYDNRLREGTAEWILLTDPLWAWPSAQGLSPAVSFGISTTTTAIFGDVNRRSIQLRSEVVAVEASPGYATWSTLYSGSPIGPDDDSDGDGKPGLLEYYLGTHPLVAEHGSPLEIVRAGDGMTFVTHSYDGSTHGIEAQVEWSEDLTNWTSEGIVLAASEDLWGARVQALHSLDPAVAGARPTYFRLRVTLR